MLIVVIFGHFCAVVQPVSCGDPRLQDRLLVCCAGATYLVREVAVCGSPAAVGAEDMARVVKEARRPHKAAEFCCGELNSSPASATRYFYEMMGKSFKADFLSEGCLPHGKSMGVVLKYLKCNENAKHSEVTGPIYHKLGS